MMDNVLFLQDLRVSSFVFCGGAILMYVQFGRGDGILNFYLYNWRTAKLAGMNAEGGRSAGRGVGVVMV